MRLTRYDPKLDAIYADGHCFDMAELEGMFAVNMLTGLFPDLSRYNHRKYIRDGAGYNVAVNERAWGYFALRYSHVDGQRESIMLDYGHDQNRPPVSWIRDYVRSNDADGIYLGKFCLYKPEKLIFVGYFLLCRARRL